MSIPDRVQLKAINLPGPRTLMGFLVFVVLCMTLVSTGFTKNLSEPIVLIIVISLLLPAWIGAHADQKAQTRNSLAQLQLRGFTPCCLSEFDAQYLDALESMKPVSLKTTTIRSAAIGELNNHELILMEHIVRRGRYKQFYISCAVWSLYEWPTTIIRPRKLTDHLRSTRDLGVKEFDEYREIESEQLEIITPVLVSFSDWFLIQKPKSMSFKLSSTPGSVEQWAFNGHWVVLADRGRTNANGLIQMADFLTSFVEEIEKHQSDNYKFNSD